MQQSTKKPLRNTPGTRGGLGGCDQTLAVKSSYAKILGKTNFHTREFPRNGSKAKGEEKKRKKKEERETERW